MKLAPLPGLAWYLIKGRRATTAGAVDRALRLAPGSTLEAVHDPEIARDLEIGHDLVILGADEWRELLEEDHPDAPGPHSDLVLLGERAVAIVVDRFRGAPLVRWA